MMQTIFNIRPRLLPALVAVLLSGFTATAAEQPKPMDTTRLVSLGGAITEIIYALGEENRLVARDSTSMFPEAAMALPDVGYMRALSPESVLSVNPSAIIMVEGSGPKETLDVLAKASIPLKIVPEVYTRDGIVQKIRDVGQILGVQAKADELATRVAADIDTASAKAATIAQDKRKRVLFILTIQNGKIMAAGSQTAADGILALSGAINATASFNGYKPLNEEAVIGARPDVILLMDRGDGSGVTDDILFSNPAIALTPAAASRSVIRMNGLTLLGFGPRTADAIRDLSKALYGG